MVSDRINTGPPSTRSGDRCIGPNATARNQSLADELQSHVCEMHPETTEALPCASQENESLPVLYSLHEVGVRCGYVRFQESIRAQEMLFLNSITNVDSRSFGNEMA